MREHRETSPANHIRFAMNSELFCNLGGPEIASETFENYKDEIKEINKIKSNKERKLRLKQLFWKMERDEYQKNYIDKRTIPTAQVADDPKESKREESSNLKKVMNWQVPSVVTKAVLGAAIVSTLPLTLPALGTLASHVPTAYSHTPDWAKLAIGGVGAGLGLHFLTRKGRRERPRD